MLVRLGDPPPLKWQSPASMQWRALEGRTPPQAARFERADGAFWLLTLAGMAGLYIALYLS